MDEQVTVKHAPKKETLPAPTEPEFAPLASLRDEVDRLFEDFMTSWPFGRRRMGLMAWPRLRFPTAIAAPSADMVEKDDEFEVSIDMPGMDAKDIDIDLSGDVLTVRGEMREERKEEKENYYFSERCHGVLQRSFRVPPTVDTAKIAATLDKGVLKLTLPKSVEAKKKQRKIKLKAA